MILQSLYFDLRNSIQSADIVAARNTDELQQFINPYVLVIHQPSRRGFYLDRQYRHIVDVTRCQEPENPALVVRHHYRASPSLPAWALQIENGLSKIDHFNNFDSFWLY